MDILSDEAVVRGLQSSTESELNRTMRYLYERMYESVRRLVLKNNGSEGEVPDVFQDGLIVLYKLALQKKINEETKVEGYLYSICRNLWLKELKKKKRSTELTDEMSAIPVEDAGIKLFVSDKQKSIFETLLSQLGKDCKQLLNYFYFDRKTMKEIVVLMKMTSEQVAKNKKSKCMKKLRELIEDNNINRDFFY